MGTPFWNEVTKASGQIIGVALIALPLIYSTEVIPKQIIDRYSPSGIPLSISDTMKNSEGPLPSRNLALSGDYGGWCVRSISMSHGVGTSQL